MIRARSPRQSNCVPGFFFLATVAGLAGATWTAVAEEVVVKNDSLTDGGNGAIQAGFDDGESAAAWLTSPCNGRIVAVQVFWKSATGGQPPSLEQSITIFANGTFPQPGPILALLEGPVMTDGFVNEFRYLDELNTIPIDVPINQNQRFVVSFEFASDPNPLNGPSVVTDTNGCQAQKNAIEAVGLGWVNACALGISGDFFIRAVVDCDEATGACCLVQGSCATDVTESDCVQVSGVYQGDGTNCVGVNCPVLLGACCKSDGTCVDGISSSACAGMSGTYQGNGTDCGTVNCPQPAQACCNPANGFCAMQTPDACLGFGGVPQGAGTVCVGPSANQCPTGACCLPNGNCLPAATPAQCAAQSGVYQGNGVTCGQVSCPQPQGACCLTSGGCTISAQNICEGFGNVWMGQGTTCGDVDNNGTADICEPPDGDMNVDGVTDGLDVHPFATAVMSASSQPLDLSHGDFSGNNVMDTADIDGMVDALLGD